MQGCVTSALILCQHPLCLAPPLDCAPFPMSPDTQDSLRPLGEIAQGPSAFEQFLDRNQKNIVILSIGVAVATAGYLVYQGIATSKEHTAGAELFKAKDLPALQEVTSKYSGTAAAGTATILLAERQWTEGQLDAAIETLKTFIAGNAKHPARPSAQASLAAKLKAQNKTPEAKQLFQEIADDPTAAYLAPYALVCLGDLAKTDKEIDQAEKFYQKAKTSFPTSSFNTTIDQRIGLLKAQLPTEIDPPPAPAPAPVPGTPGAPAMPTPGAPATIPGAGQPLIPGLPPSGQDNSDSDVPPVTFPGQATPTPMPAPAPATPEAPPAAPETPPAQPEAPPAPPAQPEAPPAPPAQPEAPPAPPAQPEAPPASGSAPVQDPAAAPRSDSGAPASGSPSQP
jgi:predicted negative regulator of RcsB-dependent stress response